MSPLRQAACASQRAKGEFQGCSAYPKCHYTFNENNNNELERKKLVNTTGLSEYRKDLGKLFFKVPLYTLIRIDTRLKIKGEREFLDDHDVDNPSFIEHTLFCENPEYELLKSIVYKEIRNLYGYCPYCQKEMILTSEGKVIPEDLRENLVYSDVEIRSEEHFEAANDSANQAFEERVQKLIKHGFDRDRCFMRTFECTSKHKHKIFVSFYLSHKFELIKIGQYPSIVEFEKSIEKYKKELSKDEFREFNKAIGMKAHGIGIGSFVYLRRIFERLIEDKVKLRGSSEEIPRRMDEKIKYFADELPSFLVENKVIYGILSKGIHELEEKECLQYFETLKDSIYFILEENKQKKDQEKAKKAISTQLNSISKGLSEK